jgi:nicotinate-nucleotide--dimethylbenzimidazole phosphoribosyltransferase
MENRRAMPELKRVCESIVAVDRAVAEATQRLLDDKTKPRKSLGRLEEIACQVAAIQRSTAPRISHKAIVVMAADHGVAEAGVSAYPQEVTAQMLLNFAAGGAAINVLARQAKARLVVVDMGVKTPVADHPEIRRVRIDAGTRDFSRGPAMTREQAVAAVEAGIQIASELAESGVHLIGIGDMGIGNTTASSALAAVFTRSAPEEVTGRGTGVDEAGLARKLRAIQRALEVNEPDARDPLDVLAKLGGFEIAGLCGVVLGAAAARVTVVLDGFIAGAAALVAARLVPEAAEYLIASHRSVEPGHRRVLSVLGARPLLDLDLRLGEGTGAALAMSLVEASLAVLHEMATFSAAHVSDSGA